MPGPGGAVVGAMLTLFVAFQPLTAPCFADVEFTVVELPDPPIVDMTKPLSPVPGAKLEVAELGLIATADAAGKATFKLPLSPRCQRRVYTFVATSVSSPHQSVLRRMFEVPGKQRHQMFFDPKRDLYNDASFKEPPRTIVTVIVTDRRGVFPVAGATVRIAALDQVARTDEHGSAEFIVPLGGPWTFDVTAPGEQQTTTFQTEVPDRGSTRFIIRLK